LEIKATERPSESIEPLEKLDRYLTEEKGKNGNLVLMLSSSLGQCAANMADYKCYGLPNPEDESFRAYAKFLYLDSLLNSGNQKKRWRTLNLSQRGNMASEDLLLLEAALAAGLRPKLVIYLTSPRDFVDRLHSDYGQSIIARSIKLRCQNLWDFKQSARENLSFLADQYLPVYAFRAQIAKSLAARASAIIGQFWPRVEQLQPMLAPQFKAIKDIAGTADPIMSSEYKKRYLPVNWRRWQQETDSLKEMKTLCRKTRIPLLVVAMPLSKENLHILPADFLLKHQEALVSNCSPDFLDLCSDNSFQSDDFLDPVHLRSSGGIKLAQKVAAEIRLRHYLNR